MINWAPGYTPTDATARAAAKWCAGKGPAVIFAEEPASGGGAVLVLERDEAEGYDGDYTCVGAWDPAGGPAYESSLEDARHVEIADTLLKDRNATIDRLVVARDQAIAERDQARADNVALQASLTELEQLLDEAATKATGG